MIGFYDYTVVLTYISFTSSIIGIFCAVTGHPKWAVFCLALAGVIRLGYFNVMETKRQQETGENRKYYQGLPITSMSVVLPLLFVVSLILPGYHWFLYALHITVAVVGILFVADFKFRKPTNKKLAVLVGIVGVAVLFILFYNGGWWEFCKARFFRHM